MLRRSVKIQLVIFVIITVLGVSYVSAEYVGVLRGIGSDSCTISADFPDSGGIFTNAEVTYRGVTVGRVGELHLVNDGVRVDLNLSDCNHPKIPVDSSATVSDRSVIGEQYVNLVPPNGNGPYLRGGEVITESHTAVPISSQQLLTDLDNFVNSVDLPALRTTIDELGKALDNRGQDLGSLLDSTNALLTTARDNLPTTVQLIHEGYLDFTIDQQPYIQGFYTVMQAFVTLASGGLVGPANVNTGLKFVTKDTVEPYLNTSTRYEGKSTKAQILQMRGPIKS